jgi:hypothetical protein
MNLKLRSIIATAIIILAGIFFFNALSPTGQTAPVLRSPVYTTGSFTFSAPLQLISNPGVFAEFDAEPEIKIDNFGDIYITAIQGVPAGTDFWKSTDKGATFPYLGQPDGAQDHCQTLPQCVAAGGGDDSIALSTGGYLYVSSLYLGSVTMSTSMDGGTGGVEPGQAWQVNPAAATIPGDDRQWVAAYGPQTVYMSYTDIGTGVIDFEKSTDGGKTFSAPVQIYPVTSAILSDVQGNMAVDQYNGNIYICFIPLGADNQVYIARSTDGGATFTLIQAYNGPAGSTNVQVFPSMAVDRGGNIHIAFSSCGPGHSNCQIELVSSTDQGNSWLNAVRVSSGAATATAVEPTIAAGSPGVVDITWLGSSASSPDVASNWHVFFSQTQNALAANPTFAQNQAEANVMHQWDICFNGLGCANNPHQSPGNRDLLEYYSMTIDPDGNANIAYPDTVTNCPTATCTTNTWFMKQTAGPSAYSPPRGPAPATFTGNYTIPFSSGDAEPRTWVDSHNCIYGTSPGNPDIWKSSDEGVSFSLHVIPTTTVPGGGDEDIVTVPQVSGARPDLVYFADLAVADINILKSIDGGMTYFAPGTAGSAGEFNASSDRMWLFPDRLNATTLNVYSMDHEFVTETIRMASSTNDSPWVTTSGMTDPELFITDNANTNPGPTFVNHTTHTVYGLFGASTNVENARNAPFGKILNLWETMGPGTTMAGVPPGPFTNVRVYKGVIDSATTPAPPAGTQTFGTIVANIFPAGDIDHAGNVYAVWSMNSARTNEFSIWMAASHDGGQNFYGPFQVSSGPGTAVLPWVAAGDAGRIDVVWYQSSNVSDPNTMPAGSTWNVTFAQSLNAADREPVFAVSQVSDHNIHTGSISTGGLFGSSDRSLLDFFTVSIGPDGLANIIYADNGSSGLHCSYARQATGPLALTNPSAVTCLPIPPLISVDSVMTHGSAGSFRVNFPLPPMSSPRGVEPRSSTSLGARNYAVVFTFLNNLTSVASASVTAHNPTSGTGSVSGSPIVGPNAALGLAANQCLIHLTNVSNAQYITVTLSGVADAAGNSGSVVSPQMGVLIGDVNATGGVDGNDVAAVQSHTRQPVNSDAQARFDVNATGAIDGNDVALTQSHTRTSLPSPP